MVSNREDTCKRIEEQPEKGLQAHEWQASQAGGVLQVVRAQGSIVRAGLHSMEINSAPAAHC